MFMRLLSLGVILLYGLFNLSVPCFALNEEASTTVVATLPVSLSVSSVLIDNREIPDSVKTPNLLVKEMIKLEDGINQLKLSSIQYKIKANTYSPVNVTAEFISLSNSSYSFSNEKLFLETSEEGLSAIPKTTKMSPKFTPVVNVDSSVPPGRYDGTIILTITCL